MLAGIQDIHADHAASHLGKAHGIVNLIRSVPYNAQRKVVALPQDVLLQHNVTHEAVLRARCTAGLKEAVFDIAARAKQHLDKVSCSSSHANVLVLIYYVNTKFISTDKIEST
jgi:NADH dehydrogenase [ubiquinone] 1 alpha subcomplex assembly factor 6